VPYPVAVTLLTGAFTPADLGSPRLDDPLVWDLAKRVRVEHDPDLTRHAVLATAPLGEALRQAGPRASAWLAHFGGEEGAAVLLQAAGRPSASFEDATKEIGAMLEVRLTDGRMLRRSVATPIGASGPSTRRDHSTLARGKFLSTGGSRKVVDALEHLEDLRADELAGALASALTTV
jgi:2-methylcitrate dehydratase PrpD